MAREQDQTGVLQADQGRKGQKGQAHARLPHDGVCAGRQAEIRDRLRREEEKR